MKRALPWIGFGLLAVVAVLAFARRSHREMYDFEVYRVAGVRAAAAEPLYRAEDGHWQFKYLPAFALAIAPLAQVGVSMNDPVISASITAAPYDGTTMNLLGTAQSASAKSEVYLFGLAVGRKTAGNYAVALTASTGIDQIVFGVSSFSSVNQTTSTGSFAAATGSSKTPSVNVSSVAGDMVVDILGHDAGAISLGANQIANWKQEDGGDPRTVTLITSPLSGGNYTLTVNNLKDRAIPANPIAPNTQATFNYTAPSSAIAFGSAASASDTDNNNNASLVLAQGGLNGGYIVVGVSMYDPVAGASITAVTYDGTLGT